MISKAFYYLINLFKFNIIYFILNLKFFDSVFFIDRGGILYIKKGKVKLGKFIARRNLSIWMAVI